MTGGGRRAPTSSTNSNTAPSFHRRLLILLLLPLLASAQDSNHFFCGTSWDDASNNCDDRQHCPTGTDDECNGGTGVPASLRRNGRGRMAQGATATTISGGGLVCFGGTTCDSRMGHGNKFKFANVPYEDISNTRFCGNDWNTALSGCSLETHCPSGFSEECPMGASCYGGLACNVQDIVMEEGGGGDDNATEAINRIDKHDARRHNFCGKDWADASATCSHWCPDSDDTLCPGGMTCFGDTTCYYEDDLVPTATPVQQPTLGPSTLPPVAYDDPVNFLFCGLTWAIAMSSCSVETHCPSGSPDDCPSGESCNSVSPKNCNIIDLLLKAENEGVPSPVPSRAPVSSESALNTKFCGVGWDVAAENCSLETHCPDDICPDGEVCYGGTPCNASEMTPTPTLTLIPSLKPLSSPPTTATPTISGAPIIPTTGTPTSSSPSSPPIIPSDDIRHSFFCGKSWDDVNANCHSPCITASDTECPDSMSCWANTSCRPETPSPSSAPVPPTPSAAPAVKTRTPVGILTKSPADLFFTMAPSIRGTLSSEVPISELTGLTNGPSNTQAPQTFTMTESPSISRVDSTGSVTDLPVQQALTLLPPISLSESPSISRVDSTSSVTDLPVQQALTLLPTISPSGGIPGQSILDVVVETSPLPTELTTHPPQQALAPSTSSVLAPSREMIALIGSILVAAKSGISNDILVQIDVTTKEQTPTELYQYDGFLNALGIISKGDVGSTYFYFGPNIDSGPAYGLANVALFLAQATVESVNFGACDDVSWEKDVFGRYPLSNACGQGGLLNRGLAPYENSNPCLEDEAFMACEVDVEMSIVAETQETFAGAPPPLACFPTTTDETHTGAWDPSLSCEESGCNTYIRQSMGNLDPLSIPAKNTFGKDNVQGCCWWGRGPFPRGSSGTCMIGKLNYYLGARAFDEGRTSARYMGVDFCKDPSSICRGHFGDDVTNAEIRWVVGMLYWIFKIQAFNFDGWSYLERLHEFVDGGMQDFTFVDDVSRIITRGCRDPNCGTPVSSTERRNSFEKIISYFEEAQNGSQEEEQAVSSENQLAQFPSTKPTIALTFTSSIAPSLTKPTKMLSSFPSGKTVGEDEEAHSPAPQFSSALSLGSDVTYSPVTVSIVSDENYKLTDEEVAQRLNFVNNYCATSGDEAKNKCATSLKTCNYGDPPCADGLACYGNVPCSNLQIGVVPETLDIPHESASAVSDENYKLTDEEVAQRLNFVNNYCATSGDEAKSKCATSLKTCNYGDPPCADGLACYGNVPCTYSQSGVVPETSDIPREPEFLGTIYCNGICLRLLTANECLSLGDNLLSLPGCYNVTVEELCESEEECTESSNYTSNCHQDKDIFIRLSVDQCDSPSTNLTMTDSSPTNATATHNSDQFKGGAWWLLPNTSCSIRRPFVMQMLLLLGAILFCMNM